MTCQVSVYGLSVIDGMIARRLVAALSKIGVADMDRLLDQITGRSINTVELSPKDTYAIIVAAANALARKDSI